ncbi:MAG: hypothetical protein R3F29_10840 [Planctomycetota bacterium]
MCEGVRGVVSSALVLLSLLASAAAQQRAVEAVVADLAAPNAVTVAKAAAEARHRAEREVTHALRRSLAEWRDVAGEQAGFVRALLLDALILREAKLPGDQLLPLLDDKVAGDAAFVLLCRGGSANEADLLNAYRHTAPEQRLRRRALGSLLAEMRSPQFLDELMGSGLLQLRVVVQDRNEALVTWSFGVSEVAAAPLPEGFPAPVRYRLDLAVKPSFRDRITDAAAWIGVAPGVCCKREPWLPADARQEISLDTFFSSDTTRSNGEAWMFEFSGVALGRRELVLQGDDKNFERNLKLARDEMADNRLLLLEGLRRRNLLTEARAKELTEGEVFVIVDERADRTKPLPSVPQR